MKHFTYELDELKVGDQLKSMTVPLKDESWTRFEQYVDAQAPVNLPSNRFKNIQLSINRNAVLPVVFGTLIFLFSFLLFNFISIKNPDEKNRAEEVQPVVIKLPEIKQSTALIPVRNVPIAQSELKNTEGVRTAAPEIIKETGSVPVAGGSAEKLTLEATTAAPITQSTVKKRSSKASQEEVLSNIRPGLISEDTDPEIRPE